MNSNELYLLDTFIESVKDVDPLLLDKFFHDGFYDSMSSKDQNLEILTLFLKNYDKLS